MSVPSESTLNPIAAHGLEAREGVFRVAGQQVTVVRKTVGEGWAIVEDKLWGISALALVDRGLESTVLVPELKNLLLNRWERRTRDDSLGVSSGARVGRWVLWVHVGLSQAVRTGNFLTQC